MINFKKRERGTPTFSSYRRRALPTYSHYSLSDIRCMDRQITYLFIFIFFVTGKYIYIYILRVEATSKRPKEVLTGFTVSTTMADNIQWFSI